MTLICLLYLLAHLVQDHHLKDTPANCFNPCDKCLGWDPAEEQNKQTSSKILKTTTTHKRKKHSINYNYMGPVINHVYNAVPSPPPESQTESTPLESLTSHLHSHRPSPPTSLSHSQTPSAHSSRTNSESDEKELSSHSGKSQYHTESLANHKDNLTNSNLEHTSKPLTRHRTRSCREQAYDTKKQTRSLVDRPGQALEEDSVQSTEQEDIIQDMGNRLFDDVFPYCQLQRYYHGKTKEAIRIVVILFLLYQGLAVTLMSICENGGLLALFQTNEKNRYSAIVWRLIAFALRFSIRVLLPLCLSLHIPIMASKPHIPKVGLSHIKALKQIFKVHKYFSSEEEVMEVMVHENNPQKVIAMSEEMLKRRVRAVWIPVLNAVLTVTLLLYLGAFLLCESNVIRGGVCNFLDKTIIRIPGINKNIHVMIIMESFSLFLITLSTGIVTNCYYYENTIARYAVTFGGEVASLHQAVRRRWAVMDLFSMTMPLALSSVTFLSLSTGKPFTPALTHGLNVGDLVNWYFWVVLLTVLQFLAFSCNRMMKNACLCSFLLSSVFVYTVEVEISMIPYGSILVLLYCALSAVCSNTLFNMSLCHLRHAVETRQLRSWLWFVCCCVSLGMLILSLVMTIYHEVSHLASFVLEL